MKAVIMAGGQGSRLAPYTTVLPKPLMPLIDRPIIDVVLRQLDRAGIDEAIISVGHLGSLIEAWVQSNREYGVPITFVYEDEPLGTAGALGNLGSQNGPFFALNGDILTTLSFSALADYHRRSEAVATMAVKERTFDIDYGVVHRARDGSVVAVEEKPRIGYLVSAGVYVFEPAIAEMIGRGERIDFPDLLQRAVGSGARVAAYEFDGYWRDIGNRDDYEAAIVDFGADPDRFLA